MRIHETTAPTVPLRVHPRVQPRELNIPNPLVFASAAGKQSLTARWSLRLQPVPGRFSLDFRHFLETNGGIVDHWSRPKANAEDKPKREIEKCHATAESSGVSDAPNDHRHYGSAYDSGTQNARERTVELCDGIERKRHNNGPHDRGKQTDCGKSNYGNPCGSKQGCRQREQSPYRCTYEHPAAIEYLEQ